MHKIFLSLFLFITLSLTAQTFHTSFSDYYNMRPADFAILNNGYVMAINYGNTYNETESVVIIKTNLNGKRINKYIFDYEKLIIDGVKPVNDTAILVYGFIDSPQKEHYTLYLALLDNNLNIVKELKFEATNMSNCSKCGMHIRATINNSGNIICCASAFNVDDYSKQGGYLLALDPELKTLNSSYFRLTESQVGLNLVDDVVSFPKSDTCLVVVQNRKALLVDSLANIIDSANNYLLFEQGYRVGRTYAGTFIDNHLYIGGLAGGYKELSVVKYDRKMNRLNTQYFGDDLEHPHTAYTNCLTTNGKDLFGLTVSEWSAYTTYYKPQNYMYVRKIDTALNLIWEKKYENEGWSYFPWSIRATPDGGFGILATRNHYETREQQIETYFIKADSLGNFDTTLVAIKEVQANIKIYPNPGSSQLNVNFTDFGKGVEFILYSNSGTCIILEPIIMEHNTFYTTNLKNGMYIYELRKNGNTLQRGKWVKQ